jgi:hypothetical protein
MTESKPEETAQDVRDDINEMLGIDQSIEQAGYFTKAELRQAARRIAKLEDTTDG